jgi:hypothetical protein
MSDEMFNEYEAGRYLGGDANPIAVRTLQRKRLQGDGPPFVKIGGAVRYRRSDLDQYIAQRRRLSTSDEGEWR